MNFSLHVRFPVVNHSHPDLKIQDGCSSFQHKVKPVAYTFYSNLCHICVSLNQSYTQYCPTSIFGHIAKVFVQAKYCRMHSEKSKHQKDIPRGRHLKPHSHCSALPQRLCERYRDGEGGQFQTTPDHPPEVVTKL